MIAQVILLSLWLIRLGVTITKHGEPKAEQKHNVWLFIIGKVIIGILLYYGGFWDKLI